ncbi:LysM domain-containing protein [Colletotrichum abscissum]|uniref:LysM domain-containing protein n=1 Tax=Colletotrichum abscissum TaxID=1671311 RepID=A0A9P9XEX9_9PEZI|nr:LysM domain-containing protein [Colletotrichum abscissum]KAI3550736.1 LysM domain-containing protein [Colletotrichum abscissum]KAK1487983.1 LysM domain-containing protein [Colletotrichum abscissum]
MSRFSHLDTDEERLPHGMRRVGYDADTQIYTYQDADGSYWEGAPGAQYGQLTQVSGASSNAAVGAEEAEPFMPGGGGGELNRRRNPWDDRKGWRHEMRPLLNFFVLIGLFLLVLTWWLYRTPSSSSGGAEEEEVAVPQCGGLAVPYKIEIGNTCWAIAEGQKMTIEDLLKANEGLDCDKLIPGSFICMPTLG